MASASVPPPSSAEVLTGETEHDPDRWLRILAWLVIALSAAQVVLFPFGRQQAAYAVVAEALIDGQIPYVDVWYPSPPGIFFVYGLSLFAFGRTMMAPRLVEVLLLVGVAVASRRLGGRLFDSRTAGIMGGAVSCLVYAQLDFWHSGHPENYAGALTLFAVTATAHDWPRRQAPGAWVMVGVLFGICTVLEPLLGAGVASCAGYLAFKRRSEARSWTQSLLPTWAMLAGFLTPVLSTVLWFSAHGAGSELLVMMMRILPLQAMKSWSGRHPPEMLFEAIESIFFAYSGLLVAGLITAAALHPRAARERQGLLLILGVLVFHLASVALGGDLGAHQFAASLPLLGLVAGYGLYKLWRRIGIGSFSGGLAYVSLLAILPLMRTPVDDLPEGFWRRTSVRLAYLGSAGRIVSGEELDRRLGTHDDYVLPDVRRTAQRLRLTCPSCAEALIWADAPELYWFANISPAGRFLSAYPSATVTPAVLEHFRVATSEPPPLLLLSPESGQSWPSALGAAAPVEQYVLQHRLGKFDLWVHESVAPSL